MTREDEPTLSIGELAAQAGVSRRTVRYYVQRGLLDAPTGLGRGSHYTQRHLADLVRIRELQEQGVPLTRIAAHLRGEVTEAPAPRARQSTWTRVALVDGIELHLRDRRLGERTLARLVDAVTSVIGEEER